jgi:DNA adenine methylase
MLRYPGGKKKTADLILSYAPRDFREYRDPFTGGNGIIQSLPTRVEKIWLNDIDPWVYHFWLWMRDDKRCLEKIMQRKAIVSTITEPEAARQIHSDWKADIAVRYDPLDYLSLNLWSQSGIVSPKRQDIASFSRIWHRDGWQNVKAHRIKAYQDRLQGATITNLDYSEVLSAPGKQVYIVIDPPYLLACNASPLYSFPFTLEDHKLLAERLKNCEHPWCLTIGNSPLSEQLYHGFPMRKFPYTGTMVNRVKQIGKTELWVFSK